MEVAEKIDREKTYKEGNEEGEDRFFRGQGISHRNDQGGQMDELSRNLNSCDHHTSREFLVRSNEFGDQKRDRNWY